jgi:aspartate racemase
VIESQKMLGIVGGMGPRAAAYFVTRLTELTPAIADQQHIPYVLYGDPRIPDRSLAWSGVGDAPTAWIIHAIRELEAIGATLICIPCNTSHYWFGEFRRHCSVPLLNIVDATLDSLDDAGIAEGKVAVLGTAATMRGGLYKSALMSRGYEVLLPESPYDEACLCAIAEVKSGHLTEARYSFTNCLDCVVRAGARAVLLACTELPLLVEGHLEIPVISSVDALARAAVVQMLSPPDGFPITFVDNPNEQIAAVQPKRREDA